MTTLLSQAAIENWLIGRVAELTETKPDLIDPEVALQSYGVTSLMAVEIAADAEDLLKIPIESTVTWDYPSIAKLASYLWLETQSA
jgi:acyl carrier protein